MPTVFFAAATLAVFFSALIGFSDIVITYTSGSCKVDRDGKGRFADAVIDMELGAASIVKTGLYGEVELTVDGETISIGTNSTLKMDDLLAKVNEKRKKAGCRTCRSTRRPSGGAGESRRAPPSQG